MADPAGGLRDRLITDSFAAMLKAALTTLGWFAPSDRHLPIDFRTVPYPEGAEIPLNTFVVSREDVNGTDAEVGSNATEDRHVMWMDFYAEKRGLAQHFIGDVRDICRGKHADAGREEPVFEVRNVHEDGATVLFFCDVEDVQVETSHGGGQPHERNWMAVTCDLVEHRP